MRDIFGLLVALVGLFIVWLWATGRAQAAASAIVGRTPGTTTANATNSIAAALNPSSINFNPGTYVPVTGLGSLWSLSTGSLTPTPSIWNTTPPTVGSLATKSN